MRGERSTLVSQIGVKADSWSAGSRWKNSVVGFMRRSLRRFGSMTQDFAASGIVIRPGFWVGQLLDDQGRCRN